MNSAHTPRNVPSDADPDVVWEAFERKTAPAFIDRPGCLRCPECKRVWPEADFRADHASFPPWDSRNRCRDCRDGMKRVLRRKAIELGVCELHSCYEPVHEKYKCLRHFTREREQVEDYRARRRAHRQVVAQAGLDLLEALEAK